MEQQSDRPDFYMRGYDVREDSDLAALRECWKVREVRVRAPWPYLLLKIDPPIIGQPFGLGDKDIDLVAVGPRHVGSSVSPPVPFPLHVYVYRILPRVDAGKDEFEPDELGQVMWGLLYESRQEAVEWKVV